MVLFSHIKRLQLIHKLIAEEKTNVPDVLAARLNISRASLYQLIDDLKKSNLPIVYSRKKKSFIYTKTVNLELDYKLEIIENEQDLININGGYARFVLPSKYINGRSFIFATVFGQVQKSHTTGF
jgi:hypothetical protein